MWSFERLCGILDQWGKGSCCSTSRSRPFSSSNPSDRDGDEGGGKFNYSQASARDCRQNSPFRRGIGETISLI